MHFVVIYLAFLISVIRDEIHVFFVLDSQAVTKYVNAMEARDLKAMLIAVYDAKVVRNRLL